MKNYPYYLYTAIGLLLLFILITFLGTSFLSKHQIEDTLEHHLQTAQQESKTIAALSEAVVDRAKKEELRDRIQKSITFSENQLIFNSVLDWSGKYICYPDKKEIGSIAPKNNALQLSDQADLNGQLLYTILFEGQSNTSNSEIILLTPVKGSDWIIGSHINKTRIFEEATALKNRLYATFAIITLVTLLFVLIALRSISRYYQRLLALKNSKLEDGVLNLSKLNTSLENYQKSLTEFTTEQKESLSKKQEAVTNTSLQESSPNAKSTKQRILTYVRNEILPVATEDISHIYVENTITYIVRKDGKRSTTGETLDQIYSNLDERFFFRVNRQIIVAVSAIQTITKFGNSKLKIQVHPVSDIDIIIGKNKAAAFKQWLDL